MPTDPLDPTEMPGEVNAWEYHIDGEDEVLLDDRRKWEDVFTVVQTDGDRWGREIRYK